MKWNLKHKGSIFALALVSVLTTVGVAAAAIPAIGDGVFYACYDAGGSVKFIDNAVSTACPKGHKGP